MRLVVLHCVAPSDEEWRKPLGARGDAVRAWHRLLAARALDAAGALDADVRVVTPGRLVEWQALGARTRARERLGLELDAGRTVDERRQSAFDRAFADGYEQVVLIAGDVPELSAVELEAAFAALDRGDACVIGPALDGGVLLAGAAAPVALGRRSSTLEAEWARAGRRVTLLPALADVDDAAGAVRWATRLRVGAATLRAGSDLLLRAALSDLFGGEALSLYDAFRACSELDALAAAPTLH